MIFSTENIMIYRVAHKKRPKLCNEVVLFNIQYNTNKFLTRPTCQFASESERLSMVGYPKFKQKITFLNSNHS